MFEDPHFDGSLNIWVESLPSISIVFSLFQPSCIQGGNICELLRGSLPKGLTNVLCTTRLFLIDRLRRTVLPVPSTTKLMFCGMSTGRVELVFNYFHRPPMTPPSLGGTVIAQRCSAIVSAVLDTGLKPRLGEANRPDLAIRSFVVIPAQLLTVTDKYCCQCKTGILHYTWTWTSI
ncbi:hypothetical protein K439DRAFT_1624305 [Ramaria rubella]|nr:hypothetical protein K439DRAFT_1624305 [Ramaria rubella]